MNDHQKLIRSMERRKRASKKGDRQICRINEENKAILRMKKTNMRNLHSRCGVRRKTQFKTQGMKRGDRESLENVQYQGKGEGMEETANGRGSL